MSERGFAVTAGLDPHVAGPLAAHCAGLGYRSLWSNDHAAADGLETLAALDAGLTDPGEGNRRPRLGLSGVDLARRPPADLAAAAARHGVDPARLIVALAPGATGSTGALAALRSELPGAALLPSALGPAAIHRGREPLDGVMIEWAPPPLIATIRAELEASAADAGLPPPPAWGYVRASVGADAETRLARDEGFFRGLPLYRRHFAQLAADPGRTGIFADYPEEIPEALAPYADALDVVVIRGLAATKLPNLSRIATCCAPRLESLATG